MRGLAREGRESAARWAWMIEHRFFGTFKGGLRCGCSGCKRHDSRAGCHNCCRCRMCSSSACPCHCSSSRGAARSSDLTEPPSAAQRCRSPEDPGRARKRISRSGHTNVCRWTESDRHRAPRSTQAEGGIWGGHFHHCSAAIHAYLRKTIACTTETHQRNGCLSCPTLEANPA